MRRINPTIQGKRYEQVSKPTARKLFKQGRTIYLNSCLMMPGNIWQALCPIVLNPEDIASRQELYTRHPDGNRYGDTPEKQFNEIVNSFENYNCDSERGKYANFFIQLP